PLRLIRSSEQISPPHNIPKQAHSYCHAIEEEMSKMLNNGTIGDETSLKFSPIITVPQIIQNNLCNKFQHLNQVYEFDAQPLSQVDDFTDSSQAEES
ncbi:transposon Ty3-I Gag-Pol polyprotein isoform X1, partial [Clarias magur]